MTDVFVSYSRKDMNVCLAFISELDKAGINYWFDKDGIEAGSAWAQIIGKALHDSKLVLLLASANSLESDNVYNEIDLAVSMGKQIVPVVVGTYPSGYYKLMYHIHSKQRLELKEGNRFENVISFLQGKLKNALPGGVLKVDVVDNQANPDITAKNIESAVVSLSQPIPNSGGTKVLRGLHDGYYVVYNEKRQVRKYVAYCGNERLFSKESFPAAKAAIIKKFGDVEVRNLSEVDVSTLGSTSAAENLRGSYTESFRQKLRENSFREPMEAFALRLEQADLHIGGYDERDPRNPHIKILLPFPFVLHLCMNPSGKSGMRLNFFPADGSASTRQAFLDAASKISNHLKDGEVKNAKYARPYFKLGNLQTVNSYDLEATVEAVRSFVSLVENNQ